MSATFVLATIALLAQLILVCWFDWKSMIIPNGLNLSIALSGVVYSFVNSPASVLPCLTKIVGVYAVFWFTAAVYKTLRGFVGLGGGDVKFLAAASAWIDLQTLPWLVLIACISGLFAALVMSGHGESISTTKRIAFGPYLALGLLVVWMAENKWGIAS